MTKKGYISVVFCSRLKTQNYHFEDNVKHWEGKHQIKKAWNFGRNQEMFTET